jgi:ATP-dependent DNA helicase PIF1
LFFIDAPGGTGKTFVLNTLASYFRSKGKVALSNASSGIAAVLLQGGRTAHSRFGIPLKVLPTTECSITARSTAGKVIIAADLIIWDESPMISKTIMASVDRLLQHLMGRRDAPFGGKFVVFSGDFRQCLPIVPRQGRAGITSEIMKYCQWWSMVKQLKLSENERLKRYGHNEANTRLAAYLMEVGNGTPPAIQHGCIRIPDEYVFQSNDIEFFVDWAYPALAQGIIDTSSSIIAPLNRDVDTINRHCLRKMTPDKQAVVVMSSDEVVVGDDPIEVNNFQEEYLNTITLPGLPPHVLALKVDTPVILLRNLDPNHGLCNGTRLQVKTITNRLLTCRVLNGPNENDVVAIPRIDLNTAEGVLPFIMRRRQFPVKVAFAMTINKAQGQSFQKVGIYLSKPVFGHGQLYVAMSRAGIAANTKLFVENVPNTQGKFHDCQGTLTKNVVYHEVLTE